MAMVAGMVPPLPPLQQHLPTIGSLGNGYSRSSGKGSSRAPPAYHQMQGITPLSPYRPVPPYREYISSLPS